MSDDEMRQFMERVGALEEELKSSGAWVFGGALSEADTATVVRASEGEMLTTDGPFAESKEHLGGFYIIEAADLDAALAWAAKTTGCVARRGDASCSARWRCSRAETAAAGRAGRYSTTGFASSSPAAIRRSPWRRRWRSRSGCSAACRRGRSRGRSSSPSRRWRNVS